jgi:hypothetical protein
MFERAIRSESPPMRTVARDRHKRVTGRDYSAEQRDRLTTPAIRITLTIPALMVRPHDLACGSYDRKRLEQLSAKSRMTVCHLPIIRRERGCPQNSIMGKSEHPNVAHPRR